MMIESINLGRLAAALKDLGQEFPDVEISCVIAYPIVEPKEEEVIGLIWDGEEFLDYQFDPEPELTGGEENDSPRKAD